MSELFDNLDSPEPSPFEALFNIQPGSTPVAHELPSDAYTKVGGNLVDPISGEIIQQTVDANSAEIDKEDRLEDLKLQGQMDTIHAAALGAFNQQQTLSQEVDPKFSARNSEVAAQFLTIALNAVAQRAKTKNDRQKLRLAKEGGSGPSTVNNNLIVASREDMLKGLFKQINTPPAAVPVSDE
jgi:hypothetical protein